MEEALFLERMQPKLREYLTQLREEAAIDIKPGVVDTGASGNEMKLSYSAYTPPAEKKNKEICPRPLPWQDRSGRSGRDGSDCCSRTHHRCHGCHGGNATPAAGSRGQPPANQPATTQQASNNDQSVQKPGKREKIRFGQAPRESLAFVAGGDRGRSR